MLLILSVILFIVFIMIGHYSPKKMGWAVIILIPILGPTQFTIVPSMVLPLTAYRIAIAISIGILIRSREKKFILGSLFKNKVYFWLLIFLITYGLSAMRDRPASIIFSFIPELLFPIIIAAFTIEGEKDLKLLTKIFAFQAAIISGFIIIEYFLDFNIAVILRKTKPTIDEANLFMGQVKEQYRRAGFYRMSGIDGHPIYTAYRMAFLFPIVLWYATQKKILGGIFVFLSIIALLFLQTRMAILAVMVSMVLLPIFLKKNLIKYVLILLVTFFALYQIPFIRYFVTDFWYLSFQDITHGAGSDDISTRFMRIPYALSAFLESPLIGHGSTYTVLYKVMPAQSNDLPAPIMYLVGGGIFAGIAYVSMFAGMLISILRFSNKRTHTTEHRVYYKYMLIAFFAGFLVLCGNTAENHVIIMLMLFTAIYKSEYIKKSNIIV